MKTYICRLHEKTTKNGKIRDEGDRFDSSCVPESSQEFVEKGKSYLTAIVRPMPKLAEVRLR